MITIFKIIQNNLKEISEFENDSWVNVSSSANEELKKLSQKLNIPFDFLTDPLDVDERARIEIENGCILIVLRVLRFDEKDVGISFTLSVMGVLTFIKRK